MEEFKNDMLTEKDARYLMVKEVVNHLIECNKDIPGVSEINWIIHVVDSPDVNAFVLPVSKSTHTKFLIVKFNVLVFLRCSSCLHYFLYGTEWTSVYLHWTFK